MYFVIMNNKSCQWTKNPFNNCYETKIKMRKDFYEALQELLTKKNFTIEDFFDRALKNEYMRLLEIES